DERIVGRKPASLSFAEAAALPLTTLTAWELMFDRMGISRTGGHAGRSMLILGGAGGVGSIAIQLAKRLARLHVTASASRPESLAGAQASRGRARDRQARPRRMVSGDERRYYGLDALRGGMMMLGIVLHAAEFYLAAPPPALPMPTDRNTSYVFDLLFHFIHSFRMPTFF